MDIEILLWFQGLRNPLLNALNYVVTLLSEDSLLLIALCCLFWCAAKRETLFVMFCFFAGLWANSFLKVTFCVVRPWLRDARIEPLAWALETATGYSFPSGHTACTTAVYGGFALLLWKKRRRLAALLAVVPALTGISRVYLGVHTPQDVLVSLAAGTLLLFAARAGMRGLDRRPERETWVLAGSALAAAALLAYTVLKPYPADLDADLLTDNYKTAGALAGMALGWFLERRCVRFDPRAGWKFQVFKTALGLGGLMGLRVGLKPLLHPLLGDVAGNSLRYAAVALWTVWLWPLLFTKLRERVKKRGILSR